MDGILKGDFPMLLSQTSPGQSYRIESMNLPSTLLSHLQARGITLDARLQVLDVRITGNVVILCRASRFALGSFYTQRIQVRAV